MRKQPLSGNEKIKLDRAAGCCFARHGPPLSPFVDGAPPAHSRCRIVPLQLIRRPYALTLARPQGRAVWPVFCFFLKIACGHSMKKDRQRDVVGSLRVSTG
jgi:hypothetical protein